MTSSIAPQANAIEDLSLEEIDEVAGGIAPAVYAAVVIGLHLAAVGMAVRDVKKKKG
jgi:lactobin A/cerein 7B family class IIb bacteriocin